jgi:glycogen synthase
MNLQVVFVANGDYQQTFRDIVNQHGFHSRVAVCDFNERLEHLAYAAADFILMPSLFEPCGLPQMIAPIYGALPVAHDTGGIHDTRWRPTTRPLVTWRPGMSTSAFIFEKTNGYSESGPPMPRPSIWWER